MLFDSRPYGDLGSVRQQVLNDGSPLAGLFDFEKRFPGNPAVCDSFVPGFRIFALADDHIETVILQVQRLSRSLNAVADDGDGLALKHFERFAQRKLFAGDNVLLDAAEIHFCHDFSDLILQLVYFFVCPDFKWSRSPVCLPET